MKLFWAFVWVALGLGGSTALYLSHQSNIAFELKDTPPFVIKSDAWVFVRVKVKNRSFEEASCRLYLTDLTKPGQTASILKGENIQLGAGNQTGDSGFQDQIIGSGFWRIFDLAFIVPTDPSHLQIPAAPRDRGATEFTALLRSPPLTAGTYDLTIQTDGKNCESLPWHVTMEFKGWPNLTVLTAAH